MIRMTVRLTDDEKRRLKMLAHQTGRNQSSLVREAIDRFFAHQSSWHRQKSFEEACGIWADRSDLPDLARLRSDPIWPGCGPNGSKEFNLSNSIENAIRNFKSVI